MHRRQIAIVIEERGDNRTTITLTNRDDSAVHQLEIVPHDETAWQMTDTIVESGEIVGAPHSLVFRNINQANTFAVGWVTEIAGYSVIDILSRAHIFRRNGART